MSFASPAAAQRGFGPGRPPRRGLGHVGVSVSLVMVLAVAIALSAVAIGRTAVPGGSFLPSQQAWDVGPASPAAG